MKRKTKTNKKIMKETKRILDIYILDKKNIDNNKKKEIQDLIKFLLRCPTYFFNDILISIINREDYEPNLYFISIKDKCDNESKLNFFSIIYKDKKLDILVRSNNLNIRDTYMINDFKNIIIKNVFKFRCSKLIDMMKVPENICIENTKKEVIKNIDVEDILKSSTIRFSNEPNIEKENNVYVLTPEQRNLLKSIIIELHKKGHTDFGDRIVYFIAYLSNIPFYLLENIILYINKKKEIEDINLNFSTDAVDDRFCFNSNFTIKNSKYTTIQTIFKYKITEFKIIMKIILENYNDLFLKK